MRLAVDRAADVAGLVLLSPAAATRRIPPSLRAPLGVLGALDDRVGLVHRAVSRLVLTKGLSDIADDLVRSDHPGYRQVPFRALLQLLALQRRAADDAPRVTQPALVMHATQDHTCPLAASRLLFERLGSVDKRLVTLEHSYHVVTVDRDRAEVIAAVTEFLARLTAGAARPARQPS
jgi:carboxylesterase